jgi:hypothetical protein
LCSLMSAMDYPNFSPPVNLATKPPRDWSKLEAEAYFHWFLSILEPRISNFLNFLDMDESQEGSVLLLRAQERCEKLLTTEQFTSILPVGRKLTKQGYALAADLGLLVARLLIIRGQGKVGWAILKKPKTDQSYNLPVLTGFGVAHLDPVAGSIGDMAWLAMGNKKPDAWVKVLEFWSAKIA